MWICLKQQNIDNTNQNAIISNSYENVTSVDGEDVSTTITKTYTPAKEEIKTVKEKEIKFIIVR